MVGRIMALVLVVGLFVGGYVWWVTRDLPDLEQLIREQGGQLAIKTTQVLAADGTVILSQGQFRHRYVRYQDVSPHFIKALLATEDRRFFDHHGVDPVALARAFVRNVTSAKFMEGGSTLTQQLVRNLVLTSERSISRKVKEMILANELENLLSKEEILELYINNVYFGEGAYGIYAASEIYFNKKPKDLTWEEGALLAGMPQAPTYYSPYSNPEVSKNRRNEVLQNLLEAGLAEESEVRRLQEKPLKLNPNGRQMASGNKAPFFNQHVMAQVQNMFDIDEQDFWRSGFRIYTTLNPRAQRYAENTVASSLRQYGFTGKGNEGALVTLDAKTGAILAYVGGKDYGESQFDRVSQAQRSPGSLFKIFTYATALAKGFEPHRVYLDQPIRIGDWAPQNYDHGHHGYMTMARALAISNNVVAVKVIQEVSSTEVIRTARNMGIYSPLENNLSLTLGSSGVNLLEIASAFSSLPNRGVRAHPFAIKKITDGQNQLLYQHQPRRQDALPPTVADTMVNMMQGVVLHGTGRGANIGRPMAGKTGTSDDNRDAWFIGFTPDVVTGVWVGRDNNRPMPRGITGGSLPATIWKSYMKQVLTGKAPEDFLLAKSMDVPDDVFFHYSIEHLSDGELYVPDLDKQKPENVDPITGIPLPDENPEGMDPENSPLHITPDNPNAVASQQGYPGNQGQGGMSYPGQPVGPVPQPNPAPRASQQQGTVYPGQPVQPAPQAPQAPPAPEPPVPGVQAGPAGGYSR